MATFLAVTYRCYIFDGYGGVFLEYTAYPTRAQAEAHAEEFMRTHQAPWYVEIVAEDINGKVVTQ